MRITILLLFIIISSSCKVSKESRTKDLCEEYSKLESKCDKVFFFEKELNTRNKQRRYYNCFEDVVSDIENITGVQSNTNKGFAGIIYLSNEDIKNDIKKWKVKCKE